MTLATKIFKKNGELLSQGWDNILFFGSRLRISGCCRTGPGIIRCSNEMFENTNLRQTGFGFNRSVHQRTVSLHPHNHHNTTKRR